MKNLINKIMWENKMKKKRTAHRLLMLVISGIFLLSGCVAGSGNYGRLESDDNVKYTFEAFEVDPAYNYYYFGSKTFPRAVVGIQKDLTHVSDLWRPIDLTPEILNDWIWLHAHRRAWNIQRYGSNILGKSGEKIGVYYSLESWRQWATVTVLSENEVSIGSPNGGRNDGKRRRLGGFHERN